MLKKIIFLTLVLLVGGAGCSLPRPQSNTKIETTVTPAPGPIANNERDHWPTHTIYKVQYADDASYDFFIDTYNHEPDRRNTGATGTYYGDDRKYTYVSKSSFNEEYNIQENRLDKSAYKYEIVGERPFLSGSKTKLVDIQPAGNDTLSYLLSPDQKTAVLSIETGTNVTGAVSMTGKSGEYMHHAGHTVLKYDIESNQLELLFDDYELARIYHTRLYDYCPAEFSPSGTYILFGCSGDDSMRAEFTTDQAVYNLKTNKLEYLDEVTKFEWTKDTGYRYKNSIESDCEGRWQCAPESECWCTKDPSASVWKQGKI
jgi:hypothetical protein